MRILAFVDIENETKKLLIYQSNEGVYLFGYDCLQDSSSTWDNWFETVEEAKEYCLDTYKIDESKWISIADPPDNCQHDFIMPTKISGRENGNPEFGKFQTLINGKWIEVSVGKKYETLNGLTGNERLVVTGLIDEFYAAQQNDISKARQILVSLKIDED